MRSFKPRISVWGARETNASVAHELDAFHQGPLSNDLRRGAFRKLESGKPAEDRGT
jgi:hypothetical protein